MYWIEITEDNLYDLQNKLGWAGNGTDGNPIVIENVENLNEFLRLKNVSSNIKLRNLTLCELKVRSCQNINIEYCNIYYCWLEFSRNIKIRNSSIVNLNIEFSRGNVITNNCLHENSVWTETTLETNGEKGTKPAYFFNLCGGFFFILLGIIVLIMTRSIIFIWVIPSAFIFLIPAFKFQRKRSYMKKFPSNIFSGNELTELKELDNKYSAIYDI